jgi:hypothetical protein
LDRWDFFKLKFEEFKNLWVFRILHGKAFEGKSPKLSGRAFDLKI